MKDPKDNVMHYHIIKDVSIAVFNFKRKKYTLADIVKIILSICPLRKKYHEIYFQYHVLYSFETKGEATQFIDYYSTKDKCFSLFENIFINVEKSN